MSEFVRDTYDDYRENNQIEEGYDHYRELVKAIDNLRKYNSDEVMDLLYTFTNNMFDKMIRMTLSRITGIDEKEIGDDDIYLATHFAYSVEEYDEDGNKIGEKEVHLSDRDFLEKRKEMLSIQEEGIGPEEAVDRIVQNFNNEQFVDVLGDGNEVIPRPEHMFIADLACKMIAADHTIEGDSSLDYNRLNEERRIYRATIAGMYNVDPRIIPDKFLDILRAGKVAEGSTTGLAMPYLDREVMDLKDKMLKEWGVEEEYSEPEVTHHI